MVEKYKDLKIRLTHYNNKTRKGDYIIITGKKGRKQYKIRNKVPIDIYIDAYKEETTYKELKNTINQFQTGKLKTYIEKKYKNKKLNQLMKKGTTSQTTRLSKLSNPNEITKIYKNLLKPLVIDEDLLDIVIRNKEKLRHRFAYKLEIRGKDIKTGENKVLGKITDIGRRTIEETYNTYYVKHEYRNGIHLGIDKIKSTLMQLGITEKNGTQYTSNGIITHTYITIEFQKGI